MRSTFTWNGHSSDEFGIDIERKPDLNRSARKFQTASVPGRNGNIYQLENAWEEVMVTYDIFAGGPNYGDAVTSFTTIMEWLNSADGYAVLSDTYDSTHYRLGVFVDMTLITSTWHQHGRATITFRCRPERFIVTELIPVDQINSINNGTNHIAKPIIYLRGGGVNSLFKMSGRSLGTLPNPHYTGTGVAPILVSGKDSTVWFVNRSTLEDKVWLQDSTYGSITSLSEGAVEYSITTGSTISSMGLGFTLNAVPDTDYTLSFETYQKGRAEVWFINQYGNSVLGVVSKNTSEGSGWVSGSLTFHTPQECGYILISLGSFSLSTQVGSHKFRKVMLAYGTTAQPFVAYSAPTDYTFTVNDTILSFSANGFVNAVIDCENEDLTIDGANGNPYSSLTDSNGNLSEQYLQFKTGNNACDFTGNIIDVNIDPRYWEL